MHLEDDAVRLLLLKKLYRDWYENKKQDGEDVSKKQQIEEDEDRLGILAMACK